jgi:hypothetical protein
MEEEFSFVIGMRCDRFFLITLCAIILSCSHCSVSFDDGYPGAEKREWKVDGEKNIRT